MDIKGVVDGVFDKAREVAGSMGINVSEEVTDAIGDKVGDIAEDVVSGELSVDQIVARLAEFVKDNATPEAISAAAQQLKLPINEDIIKQVMAFLGK